MSDAPARLDELIKNGITTRASDIHIEPYSNEFRVRFRIDGLLFSGSSLERVLATALIARIKVLAHLNIAERRLPQDGSFSFDCSSTIYDIRVATFPSLYGEKVVLRLLNRTSSGPGLFDLGLESRLVQSMQQIGQSDGFFLVTGPTGSGKTTTLHALLASIKSTEKNCVTLEDPIEYIVDGVIQTAVMPEIGLTFEVGLRSLLRQDPDIIMVGEIRDRETARVAIQAALTGHLVLSSLHTTDAPSAVIRLIDMGIEPFLVAAAVSGILAQRLARRICQHCKKEIRLTIEEKEALGDRCRDIEQSYAGIGCIECRGTGYAGRIGLFQFLRVSQELRSVIVRQPDYDLLTAAAYKEGMEPFISDAILKVNQGIVSVTEVMRVLL